MDLLDPRQIEAYFDATAPRRRMMLGVQAVLMTALAGVMMLSVLAPTVGLPQSLAVALPLAIIFVALATGWFASQRRRTCRRAVTKAWDHLQLDQHKAAAEFLTPILRRPIPIESERAHAFLLLAVIAEAQRDHEAAGRIYEWMVTDQIGDAYQLQEAHIKLAAAKLRNDELTDAVNLIRRLAQVPFPPGLQAFYDLIHLFQQVSMGHYEDAVQDESHRRSLYRRYLSTRAGYGYALLAAAMHWLGRKPEALSRWRDATTLIRPKRLLQEYPLLAPIAQTYPAVENPI